MKCHRRRIAIWAIATATAILCLALTHSIGASALKDAASFPLVSTTIATAAPTSRMCEAMPLQLRLRLGQFRM